VLPLELASAVPGPSSCHHPSTHGRIFQKESHYELWPKETSASFLNVKSKSARKSRTHQVWGITLPLPWRGRKGHG